MEIQKRSKNGKTKKQIPNERQENSLEEELNDMKAGNLLDREYKDTQSHEKRHRNHTEGPVRYKECNI